MFIPDKTKKIQQENFRTYQDLRAWMCKNRFHNTGYVLDEPWKEFFVERWEKEGLVALSMNVLDVRDFNTLPYEILEKPYQVDIAEIN